MTARGRFGFVAVRIGATVPLLLVVLFVVFVLVRFVPGDPVRGLLGLRATPELVDRLNAELGLDRPLLPGFADYVGRVVQGDLGTAIKAGKPVSELIAERAEVTIWLAVAGLVLSLLISVPLAVVAARRRDRAADHAVRAVSVVWLTLPPFWLGLVLVTLVALPTGWFPVSGFGDTLEEKLRAIALPAVTLAVGLAPIQIRALRSSLARVWNSEFVDALQAVGVPRWRLFWRHVLPNAVAPVITVLAVQVSGLLFLTVVIENTFALPGLGEALVTAVSQRDYAVVQGITLVSALVVIGVQLLADVLHAALDPRVSMS
jgi:peptide/nickel transport system permease protein